MEANNLVRSLQILPRNELIGTSKDETLESCEKILNLISATLCGLGEIEQCDDDEALELMVRSVTRAIQYARCYQN